MDKQYEMAYTGKTIRNTITGQGIKFITTSKDSNGELLEMVASWQPHTIKPPAHYHPKQREIFTVLEGELTIEMNKHSHVLSIGDCITIPAGTAHTMWNASAQSTRANWKIMPAMNTEYFLETGIGLAHDGKVNDRGLPGILQLALLAQRYRGEFIVNKPPAWLQRMVFSILAPIGWLTGKRSYYSKYID